MQPEANISTSFLDRELNHTSMDKCHAMLIYSMALSFKPQMILELGIGTGLVTAALLSAIAYNGSGELTCVDNGNDFDGNEAAHFGPLRQAGARIALSHEQEFLKYAPGGHYDFLVADADHSPTWIDEYFRITNGRAILFFHDTNTPDFAALYGIEESVKRQGLYSVLHFTRSSRPDERCERGLLMVIKD